MLTCACQLEFTKDSSHTEHLRGLHNLPKLDFLSGSLPMTEVYPDTYRLEESPQSQDGSLFRNTSTKKAQLCWTRYQGKYFALNLKSFLWGRSEEKPVLCWFWTWHEGSICLDSSLKGRKNLTEWLEDIFLKPKWIRYVLYLGIYGTEELCGQSQTDWLDIDQKIQVRYFCYLSE